MYYINNILCSTVVVLVTCGFRDIVAVACDYIARIGVNNRRAMTNNFAKSIVRAEISRVCKSFIPNIVTILSG
jgi:hypothetical protein